MYFSERSYHNFNFLWIWPEKPTFLKGGLGSSSVIWVWNYCMALAFYSSVAKSLKVWTRKSWGLISPFGEDRENWWGRGGFCLPQSWIRLKFYQNKVYEVGDIPLVQFESYQWKLNIVASKYPVCEWGHFLRGIPTVDIKTSFQPGSVQSY